VNPPLLTFEEYKEVGGAVSICLWLPDEEISPPSFIAVITR
jgi:hypothetical protein